jgi:hypothetical protein
MSGCLDPCAAATSGAATRLAAVDVVMNPPRFVVLVHRRCRGGVNL